MWSFDCIRFAHFAQDDNGAVMLRRLEIRDYGLIEAAEIAFSDGATIFTGETGSGKTMILGALACAMGARASADIVRRGAPRAIVTLAFEPDDELRERITADGFEVDPGEEATIVREIGENGKSSVRVNGRASTASYVREIAPFIAEIVGQHEAQRLLSPAYHLELVDRFGGDDVESARLAVRAAYDVLVDVTRELDRLTGDERRAQQRYDDAKYALDELDGLALMPGEDERLTERRRYLDNVERIASSLRTAHDALASDDAGAATSLGTASAALHVIAEMSGALEEMHAQATALQSEVSDLASSIARELDATEFEPGELETINARLDAIDRAKRKYGSTIDSLLAYAEEARRTVSEFEGKDARTAELTRAVAEAHAALQTAAAKLSKLRALSAKRLCAAVMTELKELALASARFDVSIVPLERIGDDGAESIEFTFAANAGEALRPLTRVASGGELSRVLLALVVALASTRERVALVFDEIDAGIGGATATAVGARLGRLAEDGQVMCVTHLAQLATWANRHYTLEKHERRGATTISVREVTGDEARAAELARMLSGESHAVALEHARSLMKAAK